MYPLVPERQATLLRPGALQAIGAPWAEWVADNRLKGCSAAAMVAAMNAAGVDAELAHQAVAEVDADPCFKAADKQRQLLRKLESVVANLGGLQAQQFGHCVVERHASLTTQEFLTQHYFGSRPVILTELARDWPALRRWTLAYFARRFGDALIEIQAGRNQDPDYEVNSPRLKRQARMRDFIAAVCNGQAGNDQYLTANNHALKQPALSPLLQDIGPLPDWFDPGRLADEALLWVGGAGVVTPMHHDTLQLMHTQVIGRKRWRLVSPLQTPLVHNHIGVFSKLRFDAADNANQPLPAQLRVIDIVVEPGETLFVPVGWWHHVQSLEPCISLSFTNFNFANQFAYDNPHIAGW